MPNSLCKDGFLLCPRYTENAVLAENSYFWTFAAVFDMNRFGVLGGETNQSDVAENAND